MPMLSILIWFLKTCAEVVIAVILDKIIEDRLKKFDRDREENS